MSPGRVLKHLIGSSNNSDDNFEVSSMRDTFRGPTDTPKTSGDAFGWLRDAKPDPDPSFLPKDARKGRRGP